MSKRKLGLGLVLLAILFASFAVLIGNSKPIDLRPVYPGFDLYDVRFDKNNPYTLYLSFTTGEESLNCSYFAILELGINNKNVLAEANNPIFYKNGTCTLRSYPTSDECFTLNVFRTSIKVDDNVLEKLELTRVNPPSNHTYVRCGLHYTINEWPSWTETTIPFHQNNEGLALNV
jgi:hypothetical protein